MRARLSKRWRPPTAYGPRRPRRTTDEDLCRLRQCEIGEVGVLRDGAIRPEHENLAAFLGSVRAVHVAGLVVKRRAGRVLLALVDEITFKHIERLLKALVEVGRDDRAGFMTTCTIAGPSA